jgi:predicted component of type VI protein secretion system
MVFGRFNEATGKGSGDFALGFVAESRKISRLQCAVCAVDEGLAVMHVGGYEPSFTGLNNVVLPRGCWHRLETKDCLDICGLYQLKVTLAWDFSNRSTAESDESMSGQKLGALLLEIVDLLKLIEVNDTEPLKRRLKEGYAELLRLQSRATRLNGEDCSGPLLYARFHREDENRHRVTHIYLPKRLPLGSSQQAGLVIDAKDVAAQHAELLFRDNQYWIRNLAGPDAVRVGNYGLALEEDLPLQAGDSISMGEARFIMEIY